MIEFVEAPMFDNWLNHHRPHRSILCVSPYIKREAVYRIVPEDVATKLLIRGNKEDFTYQHSSDIEALYPFYYSTIYNRQDFRRLQNLHMKAYLVDDKELLITSGNLTMSGMFLEDGRGNAEGGLATDDANVIRQFILYLEKLWKQAQPLEDFFPEVSDAYISYLQTAKHIERPQREPRKYIYRHQAHPNAAVKTADLQEKNGRLVGQHRFTMQDIPPKGRVEDILQTLQILVELDRSTTYRELGDILRNCYDVREVDFQEEKKENQSNDKIGQEYSRLAGYFSLVNIERVNGINEITLTALGREYLVHQDEEARKCILYEQLSHREVFQFLQMVFSDEDIEAMQNGDYNVKRRFEDFLKCVIDASEKSIDRSVKICRDLLIFLYNQRQKQVVYNRFVFH